MRHSVTQPLLNIQGKPTLFQKLRADFLTFWWFLDFDLRANVVQKSYIMKILLTLFVLLFSSSVFADDISDFHIGGMSIGDSLLNNFSKYEIENAFNYDDYPSDMKFRIIELESKDELYDVFQFY